jgi:hypothetical protein
MTVARNGAKWFVLETASKMQLRSLPQLAI